MSTSLALKAAKQEVRSMMKKRLAAIPNESIQSQSLAIFRTLASFKYYQLADRVGIYLAMPSGEVQTDAIVRHALESGKKVFVPYLYKSGTQDPNIPRSVMNMLQLRDISDYESLPRDSWGIPSIVEENVRDREAILKGAEIQRLDMLLLPGVAFDTDPMNGLIRRLGHGKGFYDYFLHRYYLGLASQVGETPNNLVSDFLLYGLALEEQYFSPQAAISIPVGEHDSLLHGLFKGNGELKEGPITTDISL